MQIGPKYKIARRLGVPVFEKTQNQKYALRTERRLANNSKKSRGPKTEYGIGMLEKQKVKYTYGVNERQFTNYVENALNQKGDTSEVLLSALESRLDNTVFKAGLATTRRFARQITSHGHILVNGVIVTIPSYKVKVGDVLTIREGSKKSPLFASLTEKIKTHVFPAWIKPDHDNLTFKIEGIPVAKREELHFNVKTVLEFYTR